MKAKSAKAEEAEAKRIGEQILKGYRDRCKRERAKELAARLKAFKEHQRKFAKAQSKLPKPDLSQIKFPHWWKEEKYRLKRKETGITLEEEKAAMWYEAARRRPEVQQAWIKRKFLDNGWQTFTGFVVQYLPFSWPELDTMTKGTLIEASYSPCGVPPEGYSTSPPDTDKAKQREVSMREFKLPETDEPAVAQGFLKRVRAFADAGFTIVAINKKTVKSEQRAFEAIKALPRTFRKADKKTVAFHQRPSGISEAEKQALEEKERQGTLTLQDSHNLWNKHKPPQGGPCIQRHTAARVEERAFHKRQRGCHLIEGKQFNFELICDELEAFDNGLISDFVNAVRL